MQAYKEALFGGCGYVPDISSLQGWLEVAWKAGFDIAGSEQLGDAVQGSHKWIGTTECCALLRYFALRARIVEFDGAHPHEFNMLPWVQSIEVQCTYASTENSSVGSCLLSFAGSCATSR